MSYVGMIIPAGGGNPERRVGTPYELAAMGYTAMSEEVLKTAFGDSGPAEFMAAVRALALASIPEPIRWEGDITNYPSGDSVSAY